MTAELPSRLDPNTLLAHGEFVRALARSLVSDQSRADDVAQDTWVAALSQPPRDASALRVWLATVVRNLAFQSTRREQRQQSREARVARPERVLATAELVERETTRRAVIDALLGLAEPYRSVLLLRFYEGLAPREIARTLDVPVETVRTRVKRGLEQLRQRLDRSHGGSRAAWSALIAPWAAPDRASAARPSSLHPWRWITATSAGACLIAVAWFGLRSTAVRSADPALAAAAVVAPSEPAVAAELVAPVSVARSALQSAVGDKPKAALAVVAPQVVHATLTPPLRTIVGRVLDERDAPIANALVFIGNQIRARGDEPFKPFDAPRDMQGTHTDSAGQFTLTGSGRWITAWDELHTSRTVAWAEAERIVLAARADVRGRVLGSDGAPVTGRKISIDREHETMLGLDGGFAFSGVELGVRGLQVEAAPGAWSTKTNERGLRPRNQGPWFGIRVEATNAEAFMLVLGERPVTCELVAATAPFADPIDGIVLGLGRIFKVSPKSIQSKSPLQIDGSLPAPHVLLTRSGHVARFEIEPPSAPSVPTIHIDLGTADLTLRAPPGTRLYVVPAGSDEFVQLMAGRQASQTVREDGEVRIAPIPVGSYDVGIDSGGIVARITIDGPGASVVLE